MHLYLLRHAEAVSFAPDSARPLSPRGREDAMALGRWLAARPSLHPTQVLHSPYLRAQQTAELATNGLSGGAVLTPFARMTPDDPLPELLGPIRSADGPLLLVGHNPHLTLLVAWLVTGKADGLPVDLATCTWVHLERGFRDGLPGQWILRAVLAPVHYR